MKVFLKFIIAVWVFNILFVFYPHPHSAGIICVNVLNVCILTMNILSVDSLIKSKELSDKLSTRLNL
jgi:uncharacterized protein YhhL (DUF1145 family)